MRPYSGGNQSVETGGAHVNISNETPAPPPRNCTGPVCGSDGNNYATDCNALDAGVAVLYRGECIVEENCTDTDGGVDQNTAGTASKGNETHSDYCLDADQLIEYTCLSNAITLTTISCGEGKECRDGLCFELPTPEVPSGCNGPVADDIYKKEQVSLNGSVYSDVCVDFKTVKDYYCEDNSLKSINHECPPGYGCSDGQCNPLSYECTETDGGNDSSVRGKTTVTRGLFISFDKWDECIDDGLLTEYYCLLNGTAASQDIECPSGKKCDNGRCIRSDCSETDDGLDIYEVGTTELGASESTDECLNDEEITEYYCYGDDIRSKTKDCGTGYRCDDGECVHT